VRRCIFEADAPGIVYSVVAIPQLVLKEGSATDIEAKLSLSLAKAGFSEQGKRLRAPSAALQDGPAARLSVF
jgi:hypothetical protein